VLQHSSADWAGGVGLAVDAGDVGS